MEKGGTGRGSMRSSSKSQFVVIGLLVLSAFLAYSYWSQSARNGDLTNELEALRIDFRAVSDKHTTAQKQAADLSQQISEKIDKLTHLEASLGETNQKLTDSDNEANSLKDQLQKAHDSEKAAQEEMNKAQEDKGKLAEELEGVKKQFTELQNAPKVCNKEECKEPVREVLGALTKSLGKTAINGALKQNSVDVMSIASDLLEGEDPAGQGSNQAQQPQGQEQQKQAGQGGQSGQAHPPAQQ